MKTHSHHRLEIGICLKPTTVRLTTVPVPQGRDSPRRAMAGVALPLFHLARVPTTEKAAAFYATQKMGTLSSGTLPNSLRRGKHLPTL